MIMAWEAHGVSRTSGKYRSSQSGSNVTLAVCANSTNSIPVAEYVSDTLVTECVDSDSSQSSIRTSPCDDIADSGMARMSGNESSCGLTMNVATDSTKQHLHYEHHSEGITVSNGCLWLRHSQL